jgi:acetyl esterase/lipase
VSPRTPRTHLVVRLLAALGLALALVGCGGSAATDAADDTTDTTGEAARRDLTPVLTDQPYTASPTDDQVLDLWVPADATGPSPVVVFVHGGGWVEGDKGQVRSKLPALLDQGFAVASIDYRLAEQAIFPAAVRDAKAAIRWLRANAASQGLDPDAIAIWGESAGGNMAALVGVTGDQATVFDDPSLGNPDTSSAVQAVVDWFGPVDLLAMQQMERDDAVCDDPYDHDAGDAYESRWLGIAMQYDIDVAERADPVTYIPTAGVLPPFSIAHGDADCVVDIGQSRLLIEALDEADDPPQVTTLTGGTHMDARFDAEVLAPTIAWLRQVLSP